MQIILYTYFVINIFIGGYWFNENERWESRQYAFAILVLSLLFGVIGYLIYFIFLSFTPILGWIYKELQFQYRFRVSDYFGKIINGTKYNEKYKTKEERLNRMISLRKNYVKQVDRHSKLIYEKHK